MNLTDFLTEKSVICKNSLQKVLDICEQTGSSLEDILICHNYVNPKKLYSAIADFNKLEFADLRISPCDMKILNNAHKPFYRSLNAIPWKKDGDNIVIAAAKITDELKQWASVNFEKYKFAITTPFDIHHSINKILVDRNNFEAIEILSKYQPQYSAKYLFKDVQFRLLIMFFILIASLFFVFPAKSNLYILCGNQFFLLYYTRCKNAPVLYRHV